MNTNNPAANTAPPADAWALLQSLAADNGMYPRFQPLVEWINAKLAAPTVQAAGAGAAVLAPHTPTEEMMAMVRGSYGLDDRKLRGIYAGFIAPCAAIASTPAAAPAGETPDWREILQRARSGVSAGSRSSSDMELEQSVAFRLLDHLEEQFATTHPQPSGAVQAASVAPDGWMLAPVRANSHMMGIMQWMARGGPEQIQAAWEEILAASLTGLGAITPPAVAPSEPVAEIVTFAGMKECAWTNGRMPPIGTKLYAATPLLPLQGAPEGWMLVPVEPTEAMMTAGRLWDNLHDGLKRDREYALNSYAAMLAATPTAPGAAPIKEAGK